MLSQNFEGNCPKGLIVATSWACSMYWASVERCASHTSQSLISTSCLVEQTITNPISMSYGRWQMVGVHWMRGSGLRVGDRKGKGGTAGRGAGHRTVRGKRRRKDKSAPRSSWEGRL